MRHEKRQTRPSPLPLSLLKPQFNFPLLSSQSAYDDVVGSLQKRLIQPPLAAAPSERRPVELPRHAGNARILPAVRRRDKGINKPMKSLPCHEFVRPSIIPRMSIKKT